MSFEWWQLLIFTSVGMSGMLAGVFLGAWMVFRTKTIMLPGTNFVQPAPKKQSQQKPKSYMPPGMNFFDDDAIMNSILNDELSPPAARLRDQKKEPVT